MGTCGTVCFGIVAVLVCGLGYFLYTPLPDYLDHPWEIQKVFAQAKIGGIIVSIVWIHSCNEFIYLFIVLLYFILFYLFTLYLFMIYFHLFMIYFNLFIYIFFIYL